MKRGTYYTENATGKRWQILDCDEISIHVHRDGENDRRFTPQEFEAQFTEIL